jgi:ribosomal protein S18 acetylase RimI-like enzyme
VDRRLDATIRPATPADDSALLALDIGEPGTGFPSVFARERTSFFGSAEPSSTLVAEVDGAVVGYLTLTHPTSLPENAHVVAIEGFTVHPERRGSGVAQALLAEAAATARRQGGTKLSLRVLSVKARARSVYEAAGFVVEGVLAGEFVIDGHVVDDVLMAMALDG